MLKILLNLLKYLTKWEKLQLFFVQLICFLPALAEVLLAGVVALTATAFVSGDTVLNYGPFKRFVAWTGIDFLGEQQNLCLFLLCLLFLIVFFKNMITLVQIRVCAYFAESVSRRAAIRLLDFFTKAPWEWHLNQSTADLQFSIGSSDSMGPALNTLLSINSNLLIVFTLFAALCVANFIMAIGLLVVGGLAGFVAVMLCRTRADKLSTELFQVGKKNNRLSYFVLHGIKEMKLLDCSDEVLERYTYNRRSIMRLLVAQSINVTLPVALIETFAFLLLPPLMWFLLNLQHYSISKTVAIMGLLAGASWRVLPAINRTVSLMMAVRAYRPNLTHSLERIEESRKVLGDYRKPDSGGPLPMEHEIRLEHITYKYPNGNPALQDVSFSIPKCRMTGIVGLSGAGKTTLVNVLTLLLTPSEGSIYADDTRLTPALSMRWHRKIGYVPQFPFIFNGTIAENIALGAFGQDPDRAKVLECCKLAQMDFLDDLENGIDTELGERGVRLSGGQLQRVAIARALYTNPEILIFDEATSSLDLKNENAIIETILTLRSSMTMIVIAHRLATVRECDRIVWMEHGSLRRIGDADEVLAEYEEYLNNSKNQTAACCNPTDGQHAE